MAKSPPSPELLEAYRLIKAGQRQQAGSILKAYLEDNRNDARAWWLLAHVVRKPETAQRCLEMVLTIDPSHEKARARLARLTAAPDEEPDDSFFEVRPGATPEQSPDVAILATPSAPVEPPPPEDIPSFEEYAAQTSAGIDPFTGQPVNNPFVGVVADDDTSGPDDDHDETGGSPFTESPGGGSHDPFDQSNVFDPSGHTGLGEPPVGHVQAPGTGNQPEWGPGLAFVSEPIAPAEGQTRQASQPPFQLGETIAHPSAPSPIRPLTVETDVFADDKRQIARTVRRGLGVLALFLVAAALLLVADRQGWIDVSGENVPDMTMLDGGTFTVDYPEGWDSRCEREASGYPVCGVANHKLYNDVDRFAGTTIDLGAMIAEGFGMALTGGDLPDTQVSIIVMDVPRTSPAYDDASWARTKYEWHQHGYNFDEDAEVTYDRREIEVDGRHAYYYEYTSVGQWKDAAWDVYVEHDGIILWLRGEFSGPRNRRIPQATIDAMIESIRFKPTP